MEINDNKAELQTNIVGQNNTQKLFYRARSIRKFLRAKFAELQKLIKSTLRFGFSSPLIKFWFFSWSIHSLLYPILRIFLGRRKSFQLCNYFLKRPVSPKILSLPGLTRGVISIKETGDYPALVEIYLEDAYCKDIIKNRMNVVDIGANIGAYTVLAAEKVGNAGKVIAIEPEPKNYGQLMENIKINSFHNVAPVKIALSDHSGSEKLYIGSLSGHHSLKRRFLFHPEKNAPFVKVEVDTLDKLFKRLALRKIDIIKIDIEGAEMPALIGAKETIKNNPNIKIIVASYHYPSEAEEVQSFLRGMGFKTKASSSDIVFTI